MDTSHGNTGNNNVRKLVELDPLKCRIFFVNSTPASKMATLTGFMIKKCLTDAVGNDHKCTRLRSGTLKVEVHTQQQVRNLHNMGTIHNVQVEVTTPFASNTVKGVVSHYDFEKMTEEQIVNAMQDVGVVACRKLPKKDKHTRQRIPSDIACLTFAKTRLPE